MLQLFCNDDTYVTYALLHLYSQYFCFYRFLWDAHNCEESLDEEDLQVSSNYYNDWADLVDLWYLGMQVLSSLFAEVSWIAEFVMETGWPTHVIRTLTKVRRGGVESNLTKNSYEELLCWYVP